MRKLEREQILKKIFFEKTLQPILKFNANCLCIYSTYICYIYNIQGEALTIRTLISSNL